MYTRFKKGMALMFAMVMMFNLSLPSAALKLKGLDKDAEQTVTSEDKKVSKKTSRKKADIFANFTEDMIPSENNKPLEIERVFSRFFIFLGEVRVGQTVNCEITDYLPGAEISFDYEGKYIKVWIEDNRVYLKGVAVGSEPLTVTVKCKGYQTRSMSDEVIVHPSGTQKIFTKRDVSLIDYDYLLGETKAKYYFSNDGRSKYEVTTSGGVKAAIAKPEKEGYNSVYIDATVTSEGTITIKRTTPEGKVESATIPVTYDYPKEFLQRGLDIWYYTNVERKKHGLKPLKLDKDLMETAALRTMELHHEYGPEHLRPDGSSCFTAYPWNPEGTAEFMSVSENIAMGYQANDLCPTGKEWVEAWMNSPSHRDNILDKDHTHIGAVGDMRYATQSFGRK